MMWNWSPGRPNQDALSRGFHPIRCCLGPGFRCHPFPAEWPDVKAAAIEGADVPRSPDAFSFPESSIGDFMGTRVGFGPETLQVAGIVFSTDEKGRDIVDSCAGYRSSFKSELQIHGVPFSSRSIIVISCPGTRWK